MNIVDSSSNSDSKPQLEREIVATTYNNSRKELITSFYSSFLVIIIFWPQADWYEMIAWFSFMMAICHFRQQNQYKLKTSSITEKNYIEIKNHLRMCLWLTAFGWGMGGIIFFNPASHESQIILILCLTTVCLAAVPSTALIRPIAIGYLAICLMPVTILISASTVTFSDSAIILMVLVWFFLLRQVIFFHKSLTNSLKKKLAHKSLQIENEIEKKKVHSLVHAIEASVEPIYITDRSGSITFTNDAFCRLSGWSQEELLGSSPRLLESENWPMLYKENMWHSLSQNKNWTGRILNKQKKIETLSNGEEKLVFLEYWCQATISPINDSDGSIIGFVAIERDITDTIEYEKYLKLKASISSIKSKVTASLHAKKLLKVRLNECLDLLTSLPELKLQERACIFLLDEKNDKLERYVSMGFVDNTLIHKCERVLSSGLFKTIDTCNAHCDNTKQPHPHGHYLIPLSHDQNVLGVMLLFTPPHKNKEYYEQKILYELGTLIGQAITNDRIQRNLQRSHQEALRTSKTKSEFLANMSHEIRTPMNGVLGMTELLLNSDLSEKQAHIAETIQRSGHSLLHILNDILDYSKIEAGKLDLFKSDFNLRVLLEDTVSLFAESAHQKGLELTYHHPFDAHSIFHADRERINQVLTNLIGNAIKFTDHGEVSLETKVYNENNQTVTLLFEIRDTGVGLPDNLENKIFSAFSQADGSTTRNYGGTGLGLSICKQLIELMGGQIGVDSNINEGSTFWFKLKLDRCSVEDTEIINTDFQQEAIDILIIDKHHSSRNIFCEQLRDWQIDFTEASNIPQAIEILKNSRDENRFFDLVFLDDLTRLDNEGLCNTFNNYIDIRKTDIVILSTSLFDIKECSLQEAISSISKPVLQGDLFRTIKNSTQTSDNNLSKPYKQKKQLSKNFPIHILVAEDNDTNQQIVEMMLSDLGCQVTMVDNGLQVVDAFLSNPEKYDLILMDCQMPEMDGFTATEKIREQGDPNITIIALTANAMQDDQQRCLNSGMDDYLSKPFSQTQLEGLLEKWTKVVVSS